MRRGWPTVPLGKVVRHRKEFVTIDELQEYKRCRVQLHAKGIVLRDKVVGTEIKTKEQQVCRAGEFLVAEIDAKVGGFGIVPADLEAAIVSSHYFLFTIDENQLDGRFLDFFIRTPAFREQVNAQGTTNYAAIRPAHVLGYTIRLPPLSEQRRIVAKIEELAAKIEEAKGLRAEGIEQSRFAVSSETSRVFATLTGCAQKPLGELGVDGSNPIQTGPFGAQLHKSEFIEAGIPVLNVGNVDPDGLILSPLDHVLPEKAAQLSRYSLRPSDLLFARSGATLGKVCLVPSQCDGWLMTGHLFRVRLDKARCLPQFAFVALRGARSVRDQVFAQVRGATRPGFNTALLSNVKLPIPPLPEQRRIVAYMDDLQAKVDGLKTLQAQTQAEVDALLPSILDNAFRAEL